MAAKNTTEATLRSKFEDGISAGVKHTENVLKQGFAAMQGGASALASGFAGAFSSMTSWLGNWATSLRQKSSETDGHFGKISIAAAAMATVVVAGFLRMAQAVVGFFLDLTKRSSEVLELRLAFESLTQTMGVSASVMERQLRTATEGLVSSSVLLKNANRVLSADIPITAAQYTQLVGNIFKLSKAAGADAPQALNTLSDALIRGNARGFQSIGVAINVKDAISQMAEAAGQSANKLENETKLRTFYNELAAKTSAAVARNAADYFSMADAIDKVKLSWNEGLLRIGEAIGRSGVLAEMLGKLSEALDQMSLKEEDVNRLALATNRFIIGFLEGVSSTLRALGWLSIAWDTAWGTVKVVINGAATVIFGVLSAISSATVYVYEQLGKLPGQMGAQFRVLAEGARDVQAFMTESTRQFAAGTASAFNGWGANQSKLDAAATAVAGFAAELEQFQGIVVKGAAGTRQFGEDAEDAAEKQKKLNEQLQKYKELLRDLTKATANPYQTALIDYTRDLERINELDRIGEARRNEMRLAAMEKYFAKIRELGQKAAAEAAETQRQMEEAAVPQGLGDVSKMTGPPMPKMPKIELTPMQQELLKVHDALQKLNGVQMDPFHHTVYAMKQGVLDFATAGTQAFASFFADLVSNQEGAGKKLLAAFMGMIGQMLVKVGTMLVMSGIAEVALAHTLVGRFMGASAAAGYKAIATGLVVAAAGGVMMGAASALAQSNQQGAAGNSFQQDVPRPTAAQQVQVINVGAAGRAQSAGRAAYQPVELRVKVESNDSHIVKVVEKNVSDNGRLRTVIQNA